MSEWISVEDDLPQDSEKVLCLTVGNFYEILCKIIGGWRCPLTSQEFYTDFVRYWQPLPKLPERSDTNAGRAKLEAEFDKLLAEPVKYEL